MAMADGPGAALAALPLRYRRNPPGAHHPSTLNQVLKRGTMNLLEIAKKSKKDLAGLQATQNPERLVGQRKGISRVKEICVVVCVVTVSSLPVLLHLTRGAQ
jgi:hypothetical protein